MMTPPFFRWGSAARASQNIAWMFVRNVISHSGR